MSAGASEPFITDVSGGTSVAVAGGAVRNGGSGGSGAGRSKKGVAIEERSPREAGWGIKNRRLSRTHGFL